MKLASAAPPQPLRPSPSRVITAGAGVTIVLVLLIAALSWDMFRSYRAVIANDIELQRSIGRLDYVDEVLTMSSRMAAATGDLGWEERYRRFEPEVDVLLEEILQQALRIGQQDAAAQARAAADTLMGMEEQAFRWIREGEQAAAAELLASPAYERQKQRYANAVYQITAVLQAHIEAHHATLRQERFLLGLFSAASVLVLMGMWLFLRRLVQRYVEESARAEAEVRKSEEQFRQLTESIHEVFWLTDPAKEQMLYVSPAHQRIWGSTPDELYPDPGLWLEAIHPEDRERVQARLPEQVEGTYDVEYRIVRPDGEVRWIHERAFPVRNTDGAVYRISGISEDVTARKQVAERERELIREHTAREHAEAAQQRIRGILESITDAFFAVDENWCFTYVNAEAEALLDRSREELLGRNLSELYPASAEREFHPQYHRAVAEQVAVEFEEYSPRPDRWLQVRAYPYEEGLTVYLRDITEHREAKQALQESEERFRRVVDQVADIIVVHDLDGRIHEANPAAWSAYGYTREELSSIRVSDLDPKATPDLLRAMYPALAAGETVQVEGFARRKDGSTFPIEVHVGVFDAEAEPPLVIGTARDVTERKRAEAAVRRSERLLSEAQRIAHLGSWEWNTVTGELSWSEEVDRIWGYDPEELTLTYKMFLSGVHPEDRAFVQARLDEALEAGTAYEAEYRVVRPDRSVRQIQARGQVTPDETGQPMRMVGVVQDITERKQVEEALRRSLREKEALLQEVHHRVKNNLQVISSLLNMQMRVQRDPEALEVLRESRERVQAMALIHETLYSTGDYAAFNLADYLKRLAPQLHRSFARDGGVELKLDLERCLVSLDTAVPLGLIASELVTNAFKHAFGDGRQGEVRVELHAEGEGTYALVVSDSGVGLPDGALGESSVGMGLIEGLVRQVGGEMEIRRGAGAEFRITFAVENQGEQ